MSEPDPEKLLAELEAARLARQYDGGGFAGRNRTLLLVAAVVVTLGFLALFALYMILEAFPRNEPPPGLLPEAAIVATSRLPK